jgi:hypothetical protein
MTIPVILFHVRDVAAVERQRYSSVISTLIVLWVKDRAIRDTPLHTAG